MASSVWLPPGFSPPASQPLVSISPSGVPSAGPSTPTAVFPALSGSTPASQSSSVTTKDPVQESLQTKTVNGHNHVVPAPSFSYSLSPSANITFGTTQQSSSNAVVVLNPSTSSMVLQPPIPGMHSSTSHSFSYNVSQSGSVFPGSQQLQTSMNVSGGIAPETGIGSSATTTSPSISVVAQTSNFTTMTSTPNSGLSASWANTGLAFLNPGAPRAPGTPGMVQSAPLSSNFSLPSMAANSSSTIMRPGMPAGNVAAIPSVPAHVHAPHPSLPAVAAPSQGFWLQPMQMGGMHRLPAMPYPATFPGPFPLMAGGMPPPSTAVLGSHPPGVNPLLNTGVIPASSAGTVHQLSGPSEMKMELPTSDNKTSVHEVCLQVGETVNEQLEAWTAHKTETGVVYYYNALTGESTYNKPLGLKGELEKVSAQPKPVSMVNLVGTDWVLVTTTDGKKYYYNSKTKVSSWQIPNEVTELRKKQDGENLKEHAAPASVPNSNLVAEKEAVSISLNAPAISTGGRDAMVLRASGMQSSALDLVKKKLQDSGAPVTSSPVQVPSATTASEINGSKAVEATSKGHPNESSKDKPNDTNGDGNVSDSSSDSEDTDSGSMKEECIIQFKEMLKERGVAPFSKWEKELPKFVFDPRFKAIPSHSTRRALFEHYVKTRMEEERKEKRAAQRAAIEGFKQILDEASEDIDYKTDYQTLRKKWGNDSRFLALDRKDRENLLKERILPLKKAAEEKAQAIRAATVSSFKSMLREKEDITVSSRWSRVKDSLRNDPRYKSVNHEDREVLFNEYLSELRAAEEEVEQEAKAKRQEQDKLKERERELRKRKEREEQEMERVRLKVRRKEVSASFQALLVETIKDPQASWTESKAKLEKDPQGRASNSDLDSSEMEKLFRDHIKTLLERCAREYRALLAEVLTTAAAAQETEDGKTVLNSWSTAKRLLKPDPRYKKMPRKEREVLWRRYAEDMLRKQKLEVDNRGDKKLDLKSRSFVDPGRSSGLRRSNYS